MRPWPPACQVPSCFPCAHVPGSVIVQQMESTHTHSTHIRFKCYTLTKILRYLMHHHISKHTFHNRSVSLYDCAWLYDPQFTTGLCTFTFEDLQFDAAVCWLPSGILHNTRGDTGSSNIKKDAKEAIISKLNTSWCAYHDVLSIIWYSFLYLRDVVRHGI